MRITVCELPHAADALPAAWQGLQRHLADQASELLLLPEFAFAPPVWEQEDFEPAGWAGAERDSEAWLARLPELGVAQVIGARPVTLGGRRFNQGFIWSADQGLKPLRRKFHLPDEPGGREARWFERGDAEFPPFRTGPLRFALNICTELWALETYDAYARAGVGAVFSPRATSSKTTDKWLAVGRVAAVRAGAYGFSSNRADGEKRYGGTGWIFSPDGELLGRTSAERPYATATLDLARVEAARRSYPRYVFAGA